MPIIRVEMLKGRSEAQKKALSETLTKGFVDSCGGNHDSIHVLITEIEAENWGIGGKLLSEKHK